MRYLAILALLAVVGGCSAGDSPAADEASDGEGHMLQAQQDALDKAKAAAAALEEAARSTEEALKQD